MLSTVARILSAAGPVALISLTNPAIYIIDRTVSAVGELELTEGSLLNSTRQPRWILIVCIRDPIADGRYQELKRIRVRTV